MLYVQNKAIRNIITNMLCLGMYLGLSEYTDMEQLKTITKHIDSITYYESAYLYWSYQV